MPRHLLTKRDSGELKFKITRLPSDDSFANSQNNKSTSLLSDSSNCMNISGNSSIDGSFGLFLSPKAVAVNSRSPSSPPSSPSSTSSPLQSPLSGSTSTPRKANNGGAVLGTVSHNAVFTSLDKMSTTNTHTTTTSLDKNMSTSNTITTSVSSSSGVLGVKKNFLHRAFQRNFSPGKVYRGEQTPLTESTSNSAPKFDSDPSTRNSSTSSLKERQHNTDKIETITHSAPGMDDNKRNVFTGSPKRIHSPRTPSNSDKDTPKSPFKSKSPVKKVSVLQFDPAQIMSENTPNLYDPSTRTHHRIYIDTENKKPEISSIFTHKVKYSPKSKTKLNPSPQKCISPVKQSVQRFPSISSPRKLDYPSIQISKQSVNTSRQEYFKDTVIPKINIIENTNNKISSFDKKTRDEGCQKEDMFSLQRCVKEQRRDDNQSSHQALGDDQEHTSGNNPNPISYNAHTHPPEPTTNTTLHSHIKTSQSHSHSNPPSPTPLTASKALNINTDNPPSSATDSLQSTTTPTTTPQPDNNSDTQNDKMAFLPYAPYQIFYAQGLTRLPTPGTHPHRHHLPMSQNIRFPVGHPLNPIPHQHTRPTHQHVPPTHQHTPPTHQHTPPTHQQSIRPPNPSQHLLAMAQNDSGYHTPGASFNRSSNTSNRETNPSISATSNRSIHHTNGSLPIIPSPPSGSYLPSSATSPPVVSPSVAQSAFRPPLYASTPYYTQQDHAYLRALVHNSVNELQRMNPQSFQTPTPTRNVPNNAVWQQMIYMASMSGYNPYQMTTYNPPAAPTLPQQAPLDLSSSEEPSTPKPIRKKLFDGHQTPADYQVKQEGSAGIEVVEKGVVKQEPIKRNPFGMNRILGVEASPVKTKLEPCNTQNPDEGSTLPSPPAGQKNKKKRKRQTKEQSAANDENACDGEAEQPPKKKKKKRDKPPYWGQEMPEFIVEFKDCPEKAIFCDSTGKYQVPEIPEEREEQLAMIDSLLALFEKSNLPNIPLDLKDNIFGLRFFPRMKTIFQAAQFCETKNLVTTYGGLAFENFRAIDDNNVIDTMLKKKGDTYYCLTKKCIDPLGTQCHFTASSLGKMRRHVKNHLPQKKWVCAFCRTQMTDQTDMARHGTTHTRLRPFPCEVCGQVFSQKVTLVNHKWKAHRRVLKKESSKNRFTCRQCGCHYKAYQQEDCVEHLRKFHFTKEYVTLRKRKRFPFFLSADTDDEDEEVEVEEVEENTEQS